MRRLTVYLSGHPVGVLQQDRAGLLSFRYSPAWLDDPQAQPLSRSLPLQPEVFRGNQSRPFFAGILPDELPRKIVARILGVSDQNDFALLERIGGECAGAITLLPENIPLPHTQGATALTEAELEQIILDLPQRPLMAGIDGLRLSLAGAQAKLPVILEGSSVSLPVGITPSTHIIKPEPDHFPGLVANESLCMHLARDIGLSVPAVSTRTIAGKPCIFIERYDREVHSDGTRKRIHQEDFCQALGIPPEKKYQQEGGPLVRDCITLLREWSSVPALDINAFLDGLIFNIVIGNADAHGKNYSFLYRSGQRRLAPFYDLVSTLAWPALSKVPAMKVGKCESIESVTPAHWKKLAEETQINWPQLRRRIEEVTEKIIVSTSAATLANAPERQVAGHSPIPLIRDRAIWLNQIITSG